MRGIGLHIRITQSVLEVVESVRRFDLPLFQCFLIRSHSARFIQPTAQELLELTTVARNSGIISCAHGSYGINLAACHERSHRAILREVRLASRLGFTHFIIHPGSSRGSADRATACAQVAATMNMLTEREPSLTFVLENSAHGGCAIGGDLRDFSAIMERVHTPARIKFCLDTAHAYAFGYDIGALGQHEELVALLDKSLGIANIALIHLNDSETVCGSKIDKHAVPGRGCIGSDGLKNFILHPRLRTIPVIMEIPPAEVDEQFKVLESVRRWHLPDVAEGL